MGGCAVWVCVWVEVQAATQRTGDGVGNKYCPNCRLLRVLASAKAESSDAPSKIVLVEFVASRFCDKGVIHKIGAK